MKALFLGIDVGTTKAKTVLFDEDGNELKLVRRDTCPVCGDDGSAYQDMDRLWDIVAETILEAVRDSENYGELKGVGVTAQGDGLWLIDKDGRPVGDATLWIDGRAAGYINRWKEANIIQNSGRVVFSGSPLALGAWYYDNEPERMECAEYAVFCKDWIKYCLTGVLATDCSDLSDASLVQVRNCTYDSLLLEPFKQSRLIDKLPPIEPCTAIVGGITREAAEKTGLPVGLPVANGMIDVAATAIGNGVVRPHEACSIVGTTVYNEMAVDGLGEIPAFAERAPSIICYTTNQWLMTMGTMMGAPNLDWFIKSFYGNDAVPFQYADKEIEMKRVGPGAGGVIYHPYLGQGGERAPFVKSSAAAQFFGLKSHHTRTHMLRAVYEGIAYSMKDCYDCFPITPRSIRLAGGGSASDFWCQMFASCLNKPVQVTTGNEIGARGAAILAAVGMGYFKNYQEAFESMIRIRAQYEPNKLEAEIYDENFRIYRNIYRSLWEVWDEREELWNAQ